MEFSSKLIEKAVNEMSQLGIGKRTALRLVLHLLKQPKEQTGFLSSLSCDAEDIKYYSCHNISDSERCDLCQSKQEPPNYLHCRRYSGCDGH
jgi:recombination protein RecR